MLLEPDQIVSGKYHLVRRLARGGMGSVWLARHVDLQVDVAIKFPRAEESVDPLTEERFRREARAAAQVRSPHVVHIHDFGIDRGAPYLAMELLAGEDLDDYLEAKGPLSWNEAVRLIEGSATGLRAAHEQGVVHRDIKPGNLFLARQSGETVVKVLDFGIAKATQQDSENTTSGLVLGSPAYMSPEQARGKLVDQRSDVWSLAAVFYKMLTGTSPFAGGSASDVIVRLCTEDPVAPSRLIPALDPRVDGFFRRALARDRTERFSTVDEFLECLRPLTSGSGALPALDQVVAVGRVEETAPLAPVNVEGEERGRPAPKSQSRDRQKRWGRIGLVALFLGILGAFWVGQQRRDGETALVGEANSSSLEHSTKKEREPSSRQESFRAAALPSSAESNPNPPSSEAAADPTDPAPLPPKQVVPRRTLVPPKQRATSPDSESGESSRDSGQPKSQTDPVFGLPLRKD